MSESNGATMVFGWLKQRRRTQLRSEAFPDTWEAILRQNVWHFAQLMESEREKLRGDVQVLVAEKNWEGCGGLEMSDEIRVTISGLAALLTLGMQDEFYEKVQSILVYPEAYVAPDREHGESGQVVLEGGQAREGEAWYRGPVILSWKEVVAGGRGRDHGSSVVLHEFAHQLDMENGRDVDGTPPLARREDYARWQRVMQDAYDRLLENCRRGRRTVLDCYGTQNAAEFFAVATEAFFERAAVLRQHEPALYEALAGYFRQDPAERGS